MNFECGMNSTILIAPKMDFPTSKDKPLEYKIKNTIFENNMFDSLNQDCWFKNITIVPIVNGTVDDFTVNGTQINVTSNLTDSKI